MGKLDGKRAIITGISSGIGRESARIFAEEGARVIGVARSREVGTKVEAELRADGLEFTFVEADVTLEDDVARVAAAAESVLGGTDTLLNNAGVAIGKHLLDTTDEEWDRVQGATLKGAFLMSREVGKLMSKGSSITNVASTGGLVALPNMAAYCAAKGGVLALTRAMAVDLAPGIRVNAVCPGAIDTPMSWQLYGEVPGKTVDEVAAEFASAHLVKRLGQPAEVANLAVFLASDLASFMTGSAVAVDGGFTAV